MKVDDLNWFEKIATIVLVIEVMCLLAMFLIPFGNFIIKSLGG